MASATAEGLICTSTEELIESIIMWLFWKPGNGHFLLFRPPYLNPACQSQGLGL